LDNSQHTIERHEAGLREERLQAKSGWTPLGARSRGRDRPTENIRQGEETATHSPATTHTNRKHWNVLVKRGLVGNSAEKRLVDLRNARIYTVVVLVVVAVVVAVVAVVAVVVALVSVVVVVVAVVAVVAVW